MTLEKIKYLKIVKATHHNRLLRSFHSEPTNWNVNEDHKDWSHELSDNFALDRFRDASDGPIFIFSKCFIFTINALNTLFSLNVRSPMLGLGK